MALLAQNGIVDGALRLLETPGAELHYRQDVNVLPEKELAQLTVRASLNDRAQYDITGIDLYVPSRGRTESITLSAPPPAFQHPEARAVGRADAPLASSQQAAHNSPGQLTRARTMGNNLQAFPGAQSAKRRGVTDGELNVHLYKDGGVLRTMGEFTSAVRGAGLHVRDKRMGDLLKAAGGGKKHTSDAEIITHLRNADRSFRTYGEVAGIMRAAGFSVGERRIRAQLNTIQGNLPLLDATDGQLDQHLHNDDRSLKTPRQIGRALRAVGLKASADRIKAHREAAGGQRDLITATDDQIKAQLRKPDGTARTKDEVGDALRSAGLTVRNDRIVAVRKLANVL